MNIYRTVAISIATILCNFSIAAGQNPTAQDLSSVRNFLVYAYGSVFQPVLSTNVGSIKVLNSELIIEATQGPDHIWVYESGGVIHAVVNELHRKSFRAQNVVSIDISSFGGADIIVADVTLPATLHGGFGADLILGGNGENRIFGGPGSDSIFGGPMDDLINAGRGRDIVGACEGDDLIFGGDASDFINAGPGNDMVSGGLGADYVLGWHGDDVVDGNAGADWLMGGAGNDELSGFGGPDVLIGEDGDDVLVGGQGQDILVQNHMFNDPSAIDPGVLGEAIERLHKLWSNLVQGWGS
jgi:Ca2+-binding RTX toxin-like protein